MSGAVRGPASRGQPQLYSLRPNVSYAAPLNQPQQVVQTMNSSTRQSAVWSQPIQILTPENCRTEQTRIYSPNASMNGRRDLNKELQNVTVPQFYPQTTSHA